MTPEIRRIHRELKAVNKRIEGISERVEHQSKLLYQLKDQVKLPKRAEVETFLLEARDDVYSIHQRLRLLLYKQTVMTEMNYYARTKNQEDLPMIMSQLFACWDKSDSWWRKTEGWTIGAFHKYLQTEAKKEQEIQLEQNPKSLNAMELFSYNDDDDI